MGVLLDKAVNLSSIYGAPYASFNPAVTSGLQVFSLLGQTLPLSLLNSASGGLPSVTAGQGNPIVSSPSGVTLGSTTLGRIATGYTDVGGSMTVMLVGQSAGTGLGSFASSETTNAAQLFSLRFGGSGGAFFGVTLCLGYNNTSGPTSGLIQGAASNSAAVLAQMALPNFYVAKADFTGLKASMACFTAPTILTGGSLTLPAGSTRPSVGNPMSIGSGSSVELSATSQSTVHAIAVFNRATTTAEDQLMYAQMQALMASRGITI
jgi:hypothetical protein